MPEGDTIFRAARTLHRALAGKQVSGFRTVLPKLSRFDEDHPIVGRTVERVESRGKWMLIHFSGDAVLATHMLMSGSWHIYRPGERWQRPQIDMRIVIETQDFVAVAFRVPLAEFHTSESLSRTRIEKLGPDLLGGTFDADEALRRLRSDPQQEIGEALLRQSNVAGVGNVFKSEVCFAGKVSPFRRVAELAEEQLRELLRIAREYLKSNVMDNSGDAIVTYTGLRRTTGRSSPGERLWVYGRGGEPCRRCGTPIRKTRQGEGARVTYWCPQCQL